jgi:hypothetical protein
MTNPPAADQNFDYLDLFNIDEKIIRSCFRQCFNEKPNIFSKLEGSFFEIVHGFGILIFGHCYLFVICVL